MPILQLPRTLVRREILVYVSIDERMNDVIYFYSKIISINGKWLLHIHTILVVHREYNNRSRCVHHPNWVEVCGNERTWPTPKVGKEVRYPMYPVLLIFANLSNTALPSGPQKTMLHIQSDFSSQCNKGPMFRYHSFAFKYFQLPASRNLLWSTIFTSIVASGSMIKRSDCGTVVT